MRTATFLSGLFSLLLGIAAAAYGSDSELVNQVVEKAEPKSFQGQVIKFIDRASIRIGANLFSAELVKGVGISARYKYAVQPDYEAGFQSRSDSWLIKNHIEPGDMLGGLSPLYLSLQSDSEVFFVRHFKTKKEALTALPVSFGHLPWNAKNAEKHLAVGDFASIPTATRFIAGPQFALAQGFAAASGSLAYIISGDFTYQVFRVDGKKFRVRIYAANSKGTNLNAKVGLGFSVFGIKMLDNAVGSIIDLDVLSLSGLRQAGHLLLSDYIFDFTYPDAKEAYDALLNSIYSLKDIELAKRALGDEKIDKLWLANMSLADEIARADRDRPNPRVQRMFSGDNAYSEKSSNFKIGFLIEHWRNQQTYVENFITTFDLDGKPSYYFSPSFVKYEQNRFGIDLISLDHDVRDNIFSVLDSNADGSQLEFKDFGMSVDIFDSVYGEKEQIRDRKRLYFNLGPSIFSKVDWKAWGWNQTTMSSTPTNDGRLYYQLSLGPETFAAIEQMPLEFIRGKIYERFRQDHTFGKSVEVSKKDIELIAQSLFEIAQDITLTSRDKMAKLMELRSNAAFEKYAFGFVSCLLNEDALEKNARAELILFAEKMPEVRFNFGASASATSALYDELRLLDATSSWERIDTRLFRPDIRPVLR